ncbi:PfkB family carbohydrate kinase [Streptomyces sp. NPDC086835]|uniref:PfkB family carbohydrate kinase n=1 Tax=Streptomyces sp. NPDC086835 TaxID=3365761 RepID=UPI00380ED700
MRAAILGETLVDLVWTVDSGRVEAKSGGSPVNVARALARLGRPVTLVTCWGDDPAGEVLQKHLAASELDVIRAKSDCARTMVALTYAPNRIGGAQCQIMPAWDPLELPLDQDIDLLHTGSLAGVLDPGATRVLEACWRMSTRPGTAVSVDLNVRPAALPSRNAYRDAAARLALLADVVKASDEDLQWLFPEEQPLASARGLLDLGPQLVIVTHGAEGASAVTTEHEVHVKAPEAAVVDPTGAGEAFQACLLDILLGGEARTHIRIPTAFTALQEMLRRCVAAAAAACARSGTYAPTREEIDVLLR